jgi:hypothetical protein
MLRGLAYRGAVAACRALRIGAGSSTANHRLVVMPASLQGLGRGTIADFGEDQAEYGEAAWQAADLDRALMQAHD